MLGRQDEEICKATLVVVVVVGRGVRALKARQREEERKKEREIWSRNIKQRGGAKVEAGNTNWIVRWVAGCYLRFRWWITLLGHSSPPLINLQRRNAGKWAFFLRQMIEVLRSGAPSHVISFCSYFVFFCRLPLNSSGQSCQRVMFWRWLWLCFLVFNYFRVPLNPALN